MPRRAAKYRKSLKIELKKKKHGRTISVAPKAEDQLLHLETPVCSRPGNRFPEIELACLSPHPHFFCCHHVKKRSGREETYLVEALSQEERSDAAAFASTDIHHFHCLFWYQSHEGPDQGSPFSSEPAGQQHKDVLGR